MRLVMQNFRSHELFDREIDKVTTITGNNGAGKTSVLEAIIFCLYGRDFYGSTGTDRYIQKGKTDATVMLTIGQNEIKRVITENSTEIYLNGAKSTQGEIDLLIGTIGLTLPGINPLYFMGMSDVEKRELFMKLLPPVDRKEIFVKKYGDRLVGRFALLSEKQAKEQLKAIENTIATAEVMSGQLAQQKHTDEMEVSMLEKDLIQVESGADIKEKRAEYARLTQDLIDFGDLPKRKETLNKELGELVDTVKKRLAEYGGKTLSESITTHRDMQDRLEQKLKLTTTQYISAVNHVETFEKSIATGKCTTCGQVVDTEYAQKHLDEQITLKNNAKELKEKLEKQIEVEGSIVETLEALQTNGGKLQKELKGINEVYDKYMETKEKHVKLGEELKDMESDTVAMNNKEIEGKLSVIRNRIATAIEQIARYEKQLADIRPQLEDMNVLVEALGPKGVSSEVVKIQTKQLRDMVRKNLDGLEIVTVRDNKTNENYKEVFDILLNGIEFKSLSFGEKLKVSVVFSIAVRDLQDNFRLPFMLLDEASVLSGGPAGQIEQLMKKNKIIYVVTRVNDTGFKVSVKEYEKR